MTIRCPVCRADNDTGPLCRRCKADLAPLFELEQRRESALCAAAEAAARGDGRRVVQQARAAQQLRAGSDATQWLAVGFLLRRDFARAVACWRAGAPASPLAG